MENQAPKPSPDHRINLLTQAKDTKGSPGVYLMKNSEGTILYIGKAKNLRNRLLTYFQAPVHEIPRVELFVSRVERFDVILTETEAEALILEATLIKKHKPKFNVRLKDDKAYPYLKIAIQEDFPRIEWSRKVAHDGSRYFGPFPSARSARQVLQLLNDTFHLRDCSDNVFRHRSRPCILHQLDRWMAPCVGYVASKRYTEGITQGIQVLEGKTDQLIQTLRKGMEDSADREEYEAAAAYRDQIRNLEIVTQTQAVVEAGSEKNRDVVGLARKNGDAHGTLIKIRHGKMTAVQHYHLQNTDPTLSESEILFDFIAQYYLNNAPKKVENRNDSAESDPLSEVRSDRPSEVLLPQAPPEVDLLEQTVEITLKVAESPVDEQLLNVARANAEYALEQSRNKEQSHGAEALEEVQEKLHLQRYPRRIECYDISNIQGMDAVASRVTFIDGAPDKNLYRRYKIRTVEGANDFAMMREVLDRRFSHGDEELPDLVVVDGGKGQLSQAVAILEELAVQGVGVVGLAKARVESDFKSAEVKSSSERIFIPNRKNPVPLLPHTGAYKLLTHVRDEAHRFAISYHRLLRKKRSLGEKK